MDNQITENFLSSVTSSFTRDKINKLNTEHSFNIQQAINELIVNIIDYVSMVTNNKVLVHITNELSGELGITDIPEDSCGVISISTTSCKGIRYCYETHALVVDIRLNGKGGEQYIPMDHMVDLNYVVFNSETNDTELLDLTSIVRDIIAKIHTSKLDSEHKPSVEKKEHKPTTTTMGNVVSVDFSKN